MADRRFQYHSRDELRDAKKTAQKGSDKCRREAARLYDLGALDEWRSELEHAEVIEETLMEVIREYAARREEKAEKARRSQNRDNRPRRQNLERRAPQAPDHPDLSGWFDKMKVDAGGRPLPYLIWEVDRRIYLGEHAAEHLKVYVESPVPAHGSIVIMDRHWLPANNTSELGRSINAINAARRRKR